MKQLLSLLHSLKNWFISGSLSRKIVLALLIAAFFLRTWNIEASLLFQGDQGRDALIVSEIFKHGDLVFIGPVTSVGNMYLGPLYYYFMVPFLVLSYPNPVGPAYAIASLGILAVWLTYFFGRKMVGTRAATIATFLLTFSSVAILYSRFSWNPNPAPAVAICMVWATYLAWKKNPWWWLAVSVCFSILVQLHYLTLLSLGGAGLIWLFQLIELFRTKTKKLFTLLLPTTLAVLVFLVSLSPLLLFDLKHNWLNAKAFSQVITGESNFSDTSKPGLASKFKTVLLETHGRSMHILFEHSWGQHRTSNTIMVVVVLGTLGLILHSKKYKYREQLIVLCAYVGTGIVGTSLYQHSVFHHYILYLFPASFLLVGLVADYWWQHFKSKMVISGLLLLLGSYYLWFNLQRLPWGEMGWSLADVQTVTTSIYERVQPGERYNIVLLSESGDIDGQSYRYYLHTTDLPPVSQAERGSIDTLFIINEDRKLKKVVDSPVYEIVVFPDKTPREVYTITDGPEITVLRKD